jgi:hypothetical protein
MHSLTTSRSLTACLIVALLAAAVLISLDRLGKGHRVLGPSGSPGDGSVVREVVDDPRQAYRLWRREGYHGRTLLYVAGRWESFDPGQLLEEQLWRAYPLKLYNTARRLEEEHLDPVTFLYVASMNGLVRRIVALLPEAEVERLRRSGVQAKDFRASARGLYQSRQGFPRWYTTGAGLTPIEEPVLIYLGASYFGSDTPEHLWAQLKGAAIRTDCLLLSREAGNPLVGPAELAALERFARLAGVTGAAQDGSRGAEGPRGAAAITAGRGAGGVTAPGGAP